MHPHDCLVTYYVRFGHDFCAAFDVAVTDSIVNQSTPLSLSSNIHIVFKYITNTFDNLFCLKHDPSHTHTHMKRNIWLVIRKWLFQSSSHKSYKEAHTFLLHKPLVIQFIKIYAKIQKALCSNILLMYIYIH